MLAQRLRAAAAWTAALGGLLALRLAGYLVFHTFVEFVSAAVAFGIFTLAWNFRHRIDSGYFLLLGFASLFTGSLSITHALAYKGMGVFAGYDANLPTQLWIAFRYLTGITYLAAPLLIGRKLRPGVIIGVYGAVTVVLGWVIFAGRFPDCYIEGIGLTPFKKISEYLVTALLAGGILLMWRRREEFEDRVLRLLAGSMLMSLLSGLMVTLYTGVYDYFNMAGHLLQVVSCYLLYAAVIRTALNQPLDLLFRNLKLSEERLRDERNFVSGVLDAAGAMVVVLDAQGRIVRFNRTAENVTGFSAGEAGGALFWSLLAAPGEAEAVRDAILHPDRDQPAREFEHRCLTRGGRIRLISWSTTPMSAGGAVRFVIATGTDITERREAELELQGREQQLRTMVESVPAGVLLVDAETGTVVEANAAAALMLELPAEQIAGRPCGQFLKSVAGGPGRKAAGGGGSVEVPDALLVTAAGKEVPVLRTMTGTQRGGQHLLLESFVDISRHKTVEDELRALAMVDELTGLYNRRGFHTLAPKEIALSLQLNRGMILLFVDLDGLGEINDWYGHHEGDRALKTAAAILQETVGKTGLVARMGGDEFTLLTPQYVGTTPEHLISQLTQRVEGYNAAARNRYEIRLSAGYAMLDPAHPKSLYELLEQADSAMCSGRRRRLLQPPGGLGSL